jgi:ABC-type sugar transport system ATPase subunit
MTVRGNLSFPLRLAKTPGDEVRRRVEQVADMLGLTDWLDRKPSQLSGSQRQRVAFGRALVRQPSVLLVEEPLAEVGTAERDQLHAVLTRLREQQGIGAVYVTHDQNEAIGLADRMVLMADGAIEQVGPSDALVEHPATLRVASYVCSPSMSFLPGELDGDVLRSAFGNFLLPSALRLRMDTPSPREVVMRIDDTQGLATTSRRYALAEATSADILASEGLVRPHTRDRLSSRAEADRPAPLPFSLADLQLFDTHTGRNVTDLVARATSGSAGPGEEASELERSQSGGTHLLPQRRANAWLKDSDPPLQVNMTATVGFNIGKPRPGIPLASEAFPEPDWGSAEYLELLVMLWAARAAVEPSGHKLQLPKNGETEAVEFRVTPLFSGKLRLRFRIYLARQGVLLQELKVDVPVARQAKAVIA